MKRASLFFVIAVLVILTLAFPMQVTAQDDDVLTANKALVERHIVEIFSGGDFDVAEEIYAEDILIHDPLNPEALDRAAFVEMLQGFHMLFPDLGYAAYTIIAQDDLVAVQYTLTGTIVDTDVEVTIFGSDMWQIEDGLIVEGWFIYDTLGFLQQMGDIPTEEPVVIGEPYALPLGTTSTTPEENRDLIYHAAEAVAEQGFYDFIDNNFAEDWVTHDMARPEVVTFSGHEGAYAFFGAFYAAIPDLYHPMDAVQIVAEGDMVAIYASLEGTFTGDFMGIPGNGNPFEVWMINWWRIEDGQIVEAWINLDTLSLIGQVTAEPADE